MKSEMSKLAYEPQKASGGELTIGDLAGIYGVSLRTLRFYEDKGLLHPRRQGTMRYYGSHDRIRLELILKGKRLGFTLSEIQELISSRVTDGVRAANDSADLTVSLGREQITAQISHLERQRADLDGAITELRSAHDRLVDRVG